MEYRSLGRTGVQVSKLCLGCMMFGGKTPQQESIAIVDRALQAGINFLDTANVYGRGASEEVVGAALAGGKRQRVVLATKVHGRMSDEVNDQGNHRRHIIQQCESSLRRLQTDWIDLYQIHRPSSLQPIDETLRALDDLVRSGKVRYIGTSTFAAWQIVESLWASKEYGLNRFVCEQPPYHLLDRRIERELAPMAMSYGIGLIPWSPLAGGLLSGKYRKGQPLPSGRWQDGRDLVGRQINEATFDLIEALVQMAQDKGCTPSQLAIAWCASRPGITSPIIGPRTMEQLQDNLGAAEVTISAEESTRLDQLSAPGGVLLPYYEADFGPSLYRW